MSDRYTEGTRQGGYTENIGRQVEDTMMGRSGRNDEYTTSGRTANTENLGGSSDDNFASDTGILGQTRGDTERMDRSAGWQPGLGEQQGGDDTMMGQQKRGGGTTGKYSGLTGSSGEDTYRSGGGDTFGSDTYGSGGDTYGSGGDSGGQRGEGLKKRGATGRSGDDTFGSSGGDTYGSGGDTYGSGGDTYGSGGDTYGQERTTSSSGRQTGGGLGAVSGMDSGRRDDDSYGSSYGSSGQGQQQGAHQGKKGDSTFGKFVEKAGGILGNKNLEEKGHERRASRGYKD